MRLTYFGGPAWDAGRLPAHGRGQEALLFRLAIDAGTVVTYRALAEDIWPAAGPLDPRSALHSLASRLRRDLGAGLVEAVSGGYRLNLPRSDVDLTRFQDLVTAAHAHGSAEQARAALELWTGDPWIADQMDWVLRDLLEDRARAQRLAAGTPENVPGHAVSLAPGIPAALSPLVGRADELSAITAQISADRLVTLIGPGGAGKTTLALEIARRSPDVLFVELAPASPAEVWAAIAGAAGRGIRLTETTPRAQESDAMRVREALQGRAVLVVLDNCEHVSAAAATAVLELLGTLPGARVLATSREPLGVPGEAFVDLGPLSDADAIELFARRVRSARGAPPHAEDATTVERIVRRLDCLPLALELAAAKARTLTIAEIDEGLDDRFALLSSGPRAADPRHQTLRALIDWSWEPLGAPERAALLAASVFPDGIGASDAAVIAAEFGTGPAEFDALVDRSLLTRSGGRFRMLETMREYGLDRLRANGDEPAWRLRAAHVLAHLATGHDARLRGPDVRAALTWFDANDESLTAALRLAQDDPAQRALAVQLARASVWQSFMRDRFSDLHGAVEAIAGVEGVPESEADVVLEAIRLMLPTLAASSIADMASMIDLDAFTLRAQEVAEGAKRHPSELALALGALLVAAARTLGESPSRGIRSWNLAVQDDDARGAPPWTHAFLAVLRAATAQNNGDLAGLDADSARALEMFEQLGDPWGIAVAGQMRSEWLVLQGRLEEALEVADHASAQLTGLTSVWDTIQQNMRAVTVLARLGRFDDAWQRLAAVRKLAEVDGSARALFQYHATAASLQLAAGNAPESLRHLDTIPPGGLGGAGPQWMAWAASRRAQGELLLGRIEAARGTLREALPIAFLSGDYPILSDLVLTVASWLAEAGRTDGARRAFAASVRLRGGSDATDPTFILLRSALGEPDLALPLSASADGAGVTSDAEGEDDLAALLAFLD